MDTESEVAAVRVEPRSAAPLRDARGSYGSELELENDRIDARPVPGRDRGRGAIGPGVANWLNGLHLGGTAPEGLGQGYPWAAVRPEAPGDA